MHIDVLLILNQMKILLMNGIIYQTIAETVYLSITRLQ